MTNIALVVLDTLRKDTFDDHFGWLPGRSFDQAFSTANWTAPAHASMFTGQYGSEVGVTAKSRSLDCTGPVLAELLREAGYRTRGLSANHNASSQNRFDRGFDEFTNPSKLVNPAENTVDWEVFLSRTDATGLRLYLEAARECAVSDSDTLASLKSGLGRKFKRAGLSKSVEDDGASAVLDWVRNAEFGAREFLFLNLMETHTPYNPPAPFNSANASVTVSLRDTFDGVDRPDRIVGAYDDAARYLSHVYEQIFRELSASFDYVVTLSDHGEMLGEHDLWNHTYGLYPEVTRVPLVVTATGRSDADRCTVPVSLLDVHATILDLAEVDAASRGQSLVGAITPRDRLVEYDGLIPHARQRLDAADIDDDVVARYDEPFAAVVGRDGSYTIDRPEGVFPTDADRDRFRERLDALRADVERREVEVDDAELSAAATRRLEELGYI